MKTTTTNGAAKQRAATAFSQTIKTLVDERGLSLNEIERRTNGRITHSFLSKAITGIAANPRLDIAIDVARFFDVSVAELVGELPINGIKTSQVWRVFQAAKRLEAPDHRKIVQDHLNNLLRIIEALENGKA